MTTGEGTAALRVTPVTLTAAVEGPCGRWARGHLRRSSARGDSALAAGEVAGRVWVQLAGDRQAPRGHGGTWRSGGRYQGPHRGCRGSQCRAPCPCPHGGGPGRRAPAEVRPDMLSTRTPSLAGCSSASGRPPRPVKPAGFPGPPGCGQAACAFRPFGFSNEQKAWFTCPTSVLLDQS